MKIRSKKLLSVILALPLAITIAGCEAKVDPNADSLDNVINNKVLRIATEATYPPMEFIDDKGDVVGFEIDLANEIAKELGVKPEIINADFAGITEGLNSNRYDAILATMNVTEERKQKVLFSVPYIDAVGLSIITQSKETSISSENDILGKTVGIQQGSVAEEYVNGKNFKEVKKYVRVSDAFSDLKAGRINAIVTDNVVGNYYMSKDAQSFKMLDKLIDAGPVAIAVKKNSTKLATRINEILKKLKDNGTLSTISMKWFGKDIYK